MQGCTWVGPSRFSTQSRTDLPALGGRRRGPKPTAGVNRLSRFRVRVVFDRFGRFRELPDSANITGIFKRVVGIFKNSVCLRRNKLGSPRISPDLTKYGRDLAEISLDLLESCQKSAWISMNLVGFHQVWSRSRRNQLGSPRISSNLTKYGRDLAESPQISA